MIKWSLKCVGHLLKILWKPVSAQLEQTYRQLEQLLSLSRPDYIRYLSAETLAFLLRKTSDKSLLLGQILSFDPAVTDSVAVAKLLFESIRTVNEQFNSHCSKLWPLFVEKLIDSQPGILEKVSEFIAEHASRESLSPLLEVLLSKIETESGNSSRVGKYLNCIITIARLKSGRLLGNISKLFSVLMKVLEAGDCEEMLALIEILLKADKCSISKDQADKLVAGVCDSPLFSLQLKLNFVSAFESDPVFYSSILRPYLALIQTNIDQARAQLLDHLSHLIVSSSPLPVLGDQLRSWSPPTLDLMIVPQLRSVPDSEKFSNLVLAGLDYSLSPSDLRNSLIALSCLRPVSGKSLKEKLINLGQEVIGKDEEDKICLLPLVFTVLRSVSRQTEDVTELFRFGDVTRLFLSSPNTKGRIVLLNFALSGYTDIPSVKKETLNKILESLTTNLSSPDSSIREMCLSSMITLLPHIGSNVTRLQPDQMSLVDVFKCLLSAEQSGEGLASYKDKLNQLERVEYSRVSRLFTDFQFLSVAPALYLFGLLHTNFTLLWSPVMDLIASYGNGLKRELFWSLMERKLRDANQNIKNIIEKIKFGRDLDNELRVDYVSYRNHLWEVLGKINQLPEAKNRDLVPLFLDGFMAGEYVEIRKLAEDREIEAEHKSLIKTTVKSLLSHLSVFAKFQDLKSLHRGGEVRELVDNLLCHKLPSVQKEALNILAAYKLKYLLPYKENLERFLEEKDFKSELLTFPLAGEDSIIKADHRQDIIPVIMRLLYGRLRAVKAGAKKKGKGNLTARRGLILHHMMGLSEEEMMIFFELVFKDLFSGVKIDQGDSESVYKYILEERECPDKSTQQVQASVEMMQVVFTKLGKLLNSSLEYLLSVIVWMGFILQNTANKDRARAVRNSLYSLMATFLNKYPSHSWSKGSSSAMLKVLVWKMMDKFETDALQTTGGLLQIVMAWSIHEKYFTFFDNTHPQSGDRILQKICNVLLNPSTSPKVILYILTIIHNLTNEKDQMEVEDGEESSTKGSVIVLKEINTILEYFQVWIKKSNENVRNITKVGIKLDILITLAPSVTSEDVAQQLLSQLLSLSSSLKKPESVLKVLTISKLLVDKIPREEMRSLVSNLVPFYGRVITREERIELSLVIQNCASLDTDLKFVSDLCFDLNSYDKRRIDEPDFERRMNAFKKIREFVKDDQEMSVLELSSVIYNCCFFLKQDLDSSLKANAIEALNSATKIMQKMSEKDPSVSKVLIDKICFDHIKSGVKNKDDNIRADFTCFLQSLVTNCAGASARLKDLEKLVDVDPDSNLLENLRHVQLHRRGRAMTKIAASLEADGSYIKTKNLTQILLPYAGSYLLNDKYSKNSDLVEQAIALVKSIAKCLPWAQYEHSIKYYIEMFTKDTQHQKQLVKITTAILDAFHFEIGDEFENKRELLTKEDKVTPEGKSKEELLRSKIFWTVNNVLLPKLQLTLSGKMKGANANLSDEDKLILRVPLAMPIIKMLKIMSEKSLFRQVPGIISKIVSFLRSKAIEIREAARSTLCSVMELLGPRYLSFVIKELSSGLTRGYHLHILTYTTHSLLCRLATHQLLASGDVDSIVGLVTEMALSELFSNTAEEKEVRKITGKLMEARGCKSYDTLQIIAKFVSNEQMFNLVKPLADKTSELSTFKNLQKIKEALRNIVLGLLDNKDLDSLSCLIFIYGIVMDKLEIGGAVSSRKKPAKKDEDLSIFIVPVAPKRTGVVAKTSQTTSLHIVHEFGLNLLYFLLKRSSLVSSEELHCQRLEPFIDILISCMASSQVSLITTTVRCLLWLVKFPLKVLDGQKILEITNKVFDLLNKFGGGTDGKGENHDLVVIASKLLVVLIRDVELTQLDENHLKTVLDYVVNDVMDPFKATTAFGLLTAILNRRLETGSTELHDVMIKMIHLSIQSESGQTRQAARSTLVTYVKNYKLNKKLARILELYCAQLGYEHEFGRLSASESLRALITVLQPSSVDSQASFLFISLSPHLVNDDSTNCKKSVGQTLSSLLKCVSPGIKEKLLQTCLTWYKSPDNSGHTQLACHLLNIFVDSIPSSPSINSKLDNILSHLPNCLATNSDTEDHLVIQALTLLRRLLQTKLVPSKGRVMAPVWRSVHSCLLHSHSWVRLLSAQLVGLYLSDLGPADLSAQIKKNKESEWISSVATVKSLVLDSVEQLGLVTDADTELGTQIVKNLVALVRLSLVKGWESFQDTGDDRVAFGWILKKSLKVANQELISSPNISTKRRLVFNLVAAACLGTESSQVENVLRTVLPPLHRAVTGQNSELKQHCQEVLDLIKSQVVEERFSEVYLEIQLSLAKQKGERAQSKKQNYIRNPEAAAKRKIKLNESKKRAKKAKFKN